MIYISSGKFMQELVREYIPTHLQETDREIGAHFGIPYYSVGKIRRKMGYRKPRGAVKGDTKNRLRNRKFDLDEEKFDEILSELLGGMSLKEAVNRFKLGITRGRLCQILVGRGIRLKEVRQG